MVRKGRSCSRFVSQQDATFLMAPENQPMKAPKTNILSDQDRIAQSRNPVQQPKPASAIRCARAR